MKFYHFTPVENLPLIQSDGGIKPGSLTGKRNSYGKMNVQGDPGFIYLWHPNVLKMICFLMMLEMSPFLSLSRQALLEVEIDEAEVERDYDQLIYIFNEKFGDQEAVCKRLALQARDYRLHIEEYTPEGCKKAVDAVSNEQWNKKPGSYRTSHIIFSFRIVTWSEIIPTYVWVLMKIVGPVLRKAIVWAEKKRAESFEQREKDS